MTTRGFTLIEMLVATAVIGMVMVVATPVVTTQLQQQTATREALQLEHVVNQLDAVVQPLLLRALDVKLLDNQTLTFRNTNGHAFVIAMVAVTGGKKPLLCEEEEGMDCDTAPDLVTWTHLLPDNVVLSQGEIAVGNGVSQHVLITLSLQLLDVETQISSALFSLSFTPRVYVE